MAYIPPHKRHTEDTDKPEPSPALLVPQFKRNLSLGTSNSSFNRKNDKQKLPGWKPVYANSAVSRWFAVGPTNDDILPSSVNLQQVSSGYVKFKDGERPVVLVNTEVGTTEVVSTMRSPWIIIAENVLQDLLSSFHALMNETESNNFVNVKPLLVARFGKIVFHRKPSVNLETIENNVLPLSSLSNLRKSFYTNLPSSYLKSITTQVVKELCLDVEKEKETYHVMLSDKEQPDATISCKCKVTPDGQGLELSKIELNSIRHSVMNISCLTKKLDLRLMLCTKRTINTLCDVEKHSIQDLVHSAVLDSKTKGGLRWPLGKDCSGDCRYKVVEVWHTKAESYKNSNLRLRVRSADRFDFRTSTGEFSREVVLLLTGIISKLKESNVEISSLLEVLADSIEVIWNHFLHCDSQLGLYSTTS